MSSLKRKVVVVVATIGMIVGLLPTLAVPVGAQTSPGDVGFTGADSPRSPRSAPTSPADRRVPAAGEGAGIQAGVIDGRTVRSDVVPDPEAFEPGPTIGGVDGNPQTAPVKPYDGPEGYIEGESVWDPDTSNEYAQVFFNPDGSMTVVHTTEPSKVEADGFTVRPMSAPELVLEPTGEFIADGEMETEVRVPTQADANESLAELTIDDQTIGIRPGRVDADVPVEPSERPAPIEESPIDARPLEDSNGRVPQVETPGQDERERDVENEEIKPTEEAVAPGNSDATKATQAPGEPGVVRFDNAVDDVDIEVATTVRGVKFNYVLESADQADGLVETIELPAGWSVNQLNGFIEILDEKGERAGFWTGGPATDSSDAVVDGPPVMVTLELVSTNETSATARLMVDAKWLEDPTRVYPVRLDPVVTTGNPVAQDTWIGEEEPAVSPTEGVLSLGSYWISGTHYDRYALIEFELLFGINGFPVQPDVQSANLIVTSSFASTPTTCGVEDISVRRIGTAWDEGDVTWGTQPGSIYMNEGDATFNNCIVDNTFAIPVGNTVDYWTNNPGTNHGFLIHTPQNEDAPYRQIYSSDHSGNTAHLPRLQITYDIDSYGAEFTPAAEGQDYLGQPVPLEVTLPRPGSTENEDHFGAFPLLIQNLGQTNWNSGQNPSVPNPPTANQVFLSYHVTAGSTQPSSPAGWDEFDGKRTALPAGSSNMYDYWTAYGAGSSLPTPIPGVAADALIRNSDYSTAGVRNVYFAMVHEDQAWFEDFGSPLSEPEPIRWTNPPTLDGPLSGSVYSKLETVTFDWTRPHQGEIGAWTPQEYRLRAVNAGSEVLNIDVTGTTHTVSAASLGTGTITWTVEARDIANESAGDPRRYTAPAEPRSVYVTGVQLGSSPLSDQFGGVNPATGNFYTSVTDISIPSVSGLLEVVRHHNSQDLEVGIFGPGIRTNLESSFNCVSASCDETEGDRVLKRADGSTVLFGFDSPPTVTPPSGAIYKPVDGSDLVAERVTGSQWEIRYPSGRIDTYWNGAVTGERFGDYGGTTSPEGHALQVTPDPSTGYPVSILDVESGRRINFEYVATAPVGSSPSLRQVSRIWSSTSPVDPNNLSVREAGHEEVNYLYHNDWSFSSAANRLGFTNGATFDANGRIDTITWAANDRQVDLGYYADNTVSSVTNGVVSTAANPVQATTFVYDFANNSTTINDGRGLNWTVEFDSRNRTTTLTPPAGSFTTYGYDDSTGQLGSYRTLISREVDASPSQTSTSTLRYGEIEADEYEYGNLLTSTNGEGETTFYLYESDNYDSVDHVTGPSHVCDARSTDANGDLRPDALTYCTEYTYDLYGNKESETEPGESPGQAEEWIYTSGNTGVPAGLISEHRLGNARPGMAEGVTSYQYNADGDLTQTTDVNGLVTGYTHDAFGRVLTERITDSAAGISNQMVATHTYDAAGRLQTTTGPVITNPITNVAHQYQVEYDIDQNGMLDIKTERDLQGNSPDRFWTYTHDPMDRVVATQDPENQGSAASFVTRYDANGNKTAIVDYRGNEVQTSYDNRNLPNVTQAIGFDHDADPATPDEGVRVLVDRDYDAGGRLEVVKTYTDTLDFYTETFTYDRADRQLTVSRAEDGVSTTTSLSLYDGDGFLEEVRTGDTAGTEPQDISVTSYEYSPDGRVEEQDANGRISTFEYDPIGNVTKLTTVGLDNYASTPGNDVNTTTVVSSEYDSASNLVTVTTANSDGTNGDLVTRFSYDNRGLIMTETNPRLFVTNHDYDLLGRLAETQLPPVDWEAAPIPNTSAIEANWATGNARPTIEYGFNAFGDQTHLQDPNGSVTVTTYDDNARRTRVDHPAATQPDGSAADPAFEVWTYDTNGNTESYRTRNNNTTDYRFDDANRVVTQLDPALTNPGDTPLSRGETTTQYDFAGRVISGTDQIGAEVQTDYDHRGWTETVTQTVRALPGTSQRNSEVIFTYSGLGYTTSETDAEGATTSTEYDTWGNPLKITTGTGTEELVPTEFVYDGVGRVRETTSPSGESMVTTYDQAGRPTTVVEVGASASAYRTTATEYDNAGNVTATTSGRGATTTYVYDDLGRLSSVAAPVDGTQSITYDYGYDLNGNATRFTDGNGNVTRTVFNEWDLPTVVLEPSATTSPTQAESARLFRTHYNPGGQPKQEIQPGARVRNTAYNTLGLPHTDTNAQVGRATVGRTMKYDRAGRVVETSHPTTPIVFTYDDAGLLVTQTGGAGDTTTTYDDAGRPLTQTDEAGSREYDYELTTGLLESIQDAATSGGGGGAGSLDIIMIVGQAPGLYSNEQAVYDHLVSAGHTVTLRDNQEPETTAVGDLVLIAHGGYLGNKYEDAAVPTINFAAFRWDDHELTMGNNAGQTSTATIDVTDPAHPMAAGNSGTTSVLTTSRNVQYVTSSQFGSSPPDVVATNGTTDQIVLIGYEENSFLTDGSQAAEARVGLSIFGASNALPTADGLAILDAAIAWTGAGSGSTGGGGTPSWSETYEYDPASGRLLATTYQDGGTRTLGYDDAGRMNSDTVSDGTNTTAATTYTYSCDHELIAKDTDLDGNSGDGLNAYTYDHAGRLTSWDNTGTATIPDVCPGAGTSGGGSGSGSATLDVLLLVNNPASLQNTEQRISDEFVSDGHNVTVRDAGDPEIAWSGVVVIADTAGLGSKYASAATPIVDLIPWHFDDLGMTTADHNAVAWEDEMTIVAPSHPLAAGLTGTTQVLQASHGMAYHDSTKFGSAMPDLVADLASTPGWRVLMGYIDGQPLADGTDAPEARVGLSGFHGSNAIPTTAGFDLLEAALQWANNPNGSGGGTPTGGGWTPSGEIYTYDDAGNRLTAGSDTFTYDNRNRLATDSDGAYVWNADGTLDTYTPNTGPIEDYTFDAAGRLVEVTDGTLDADYTYDSLDRIAERDGEPFTYNGGQWDPTSDGTDTFHRTTGGSLLAYETSAGVNHAVDNNHFDLTALVGSDGTVSDTATYDPWGDPIGTTGSTNPVLGYQSDYTDPDTDKVWMGTRWYQPTSGTFLSRDTYAGELQTPFTLNRYTYATNNPTNRWDPDGRYASTMTITLEEGVTTVITVDADNNVDVTTTVASGLPKGWKGDPEPPPAPVPVGLPTTAEELAAQLNNTLIVTPDTMDMLAGLEQTFADRMAAGYDDFDISDFGLCNLWVPGLINTNAACGGADFFIDAGIEGYGLLANPEDVGLGLVSLGALGYNCGGAAGQAAKAQCGALLYDLASASAAELKARCDENGYSNCAGYLAAAVASSVIGPSSFGTGTSRAIWKADDFAGVLPAARTPLATTSRIDDLVVLGKSDGLAGIADKLGGRHLMASPDWQADVMATIANPNSRIAVALDGLDGTGSVSSRILAGVQRDASGAGSPFDWELAQLYQSGRLSTTELFENGAAISNPFG